MKTLLYTSLLLVTFSAQALEHKAKALVRNDNFNPEITEVTLVDLESDSAFDGTHFKVVKGKDEEAVKFNADEHLRLRAATTYYHLTKAREYFVNTLKSDYASKIPKITVRIEHTNKFSELGHFENDNKEAQFNNALTIPAGQGIEIFRQRGGKPWNMEIWFRPTKRVNIKDLRVNNLAMQDTMVLFKSFRDQIHMQSFQKFLSNVAVSFVDKQSQLQPFSPESLIRTAGASIIMEAGYQFVDPISRALSRKWYYLDTAMIPEIIYHEYSHAALSNHMQLTHSTAINEGMADFFAGQIAHSPKLATKIKEYNVYNGKNAKRKQDYKIQFEMTDYANTDFVFGLLWSLKKIVGQDKGEAFMFSLASKLETNSNIRKGLIDGIILTCDEMCDSPFTDKLRILKSLNSKGI